MTISFIGREIRIPRENHRPATSNWATLLHNVVSSTSGHERGSNFIVVINTDYTSSCKSNYRTLMTMTVPNKYVRMAKLSMQCHMFTKWVFNNLLLCQQVKKILKQDTKNMVFTFCLFIRKCVVSDFVCNTFSIYGVITRYCYSVRANCSRLSHPVDIMAWSSIVASRMVKITWSG